MVIHLKIHLNFRLIFILLGCKENPQVGQHASLHVQYLTVARVYLGFINLVTGLLEIDLEGK